MGVLGGGGGGRGGGGRRGGSERGAMEVESGSGSGSGNEIQIDKRFILSASDFFGKVTNFKKIRWDRGTYTLFYKNQLF